MTNLQTKDNMSKAITPFHLNLKRKWYDMILNGIKKEEYRGLHWEKTFKGATYIEEGKIRIAGEWIDAKDVTIVFSNGYAKDRPQFTINCLGLEKRQGLKKWGAKDGETYYTLLLGNEIEDLTPLIRLAQRTPNPKA